MDDADRGPKCKGGTASRQPLPYGGHPEIAEGPPKAKGRTKEEQYLYIMQAAQETASCKIGITNDLGRRLAEYNSTTGKSKNNPSAYLYTCETKNMKALEKAITEAFGHLREESRREMYFYNKGLFGQYVDFIEGHESFKGRVSIIEKPKAVLKIVKKTTPTLGERGMTFKSVMDRAKRVDNDEFYTRYEDVEKEIGMYDKKTWEGKTVFCNCDDAVGDGDAATSAFALYFIRNFRALKLKKLICTHYGGQVDLFGQGAKGYVFTKTGYRSLGKYARPEGYDGAFDHPMSMEILEQEADVVCTNPPFSRMIDYWRLVVKSRKKFLIISNVANAINTAYIPYFQRGEVWAGYHEVSEFLNPKREVVRAAGHWYTNIPIKERPKHKLLKIVPLRQIPEKHKTFDDSRTLLVDNGYIPSDYSKPFAVSARAVLNGLLEKGFEMASAARYTPYVDGQEKFARALIKNKKARHRG